MSEILHFPMEINMADLMFVGISILFFAACFGLMKFFGSLSRGE